MMSHLHSLMYRFDRFHLKYSMYFLFIFIVIISFFLFIFPQSNLSFAYFRIIASSKWK